ncbi:hypothetical protein [Paeniglutamicibacter kerguelensis]
MHPDDHEFVHKGLSVIYKYRRSLQDRRHLLVVFSGGFGEDKRYDLNGSVVDGIRTDILWIRDRFDGDFSYYIRTHKRGELIAEAVNALIEKIRLERGLEKQHCTFLGFSKGASGALFHAIANDYPNVIAVVPRMNIGTANRRQRPQVLKQLIGEDTDQGVAELDELLPSMLANDANRARNIYVFSSPADPQYKTEIIPFIPAYERYENFNLVVTESPLVVRHRDVGSYNIPLLLATLAALGEGAVPRYGNVRNGTKVFSSSVPAPSIDAVRDRRETVSRLTSLALRDGRFYPEGLLFVKGQGTKGAEQFSRKLVLASGRRSRSYELESLTDDRLNRTFFENQFCDYSEGKFATVERGGIDLAELAPGRYTLRLELEHSGVSASVDDVSADPLDVSAAVGKHLVRLRSTGDSVVLHKGSILAGCGAGSHFKLGKVMAGGSKVHVEGQYVLPGIRTPRRATMSYYLVLAKAGTHTPVASYPLTTSRRKFSGESVGDPLGNYGFTYFGTPSNEGIPLAGAVPGEYDLFITASAGSIATSHATGLRLMVSGKGETVECSIRSIWPVPGGQRAAAWMANNRPSVARSLRRDLGRIKRRVFAAKP